MIPLPFKIVEPYTAFARRTGVSHDEIVDYLKWLKYYWDFCKKYSHAPTSTSSLAPFLKKLEQKKQNEAQIELAQNAIELFHQLLDPYKLKPGAKPAKSSQETDSADLSKNQSWKTEFSSLADEIKLRQYSRRTLGAYSVWLRKFQTFVNSKSPS
jgi:hypothetical protein